MSSLDVAVHQIGEIIRRARIEAGMTQSELAQKADIRREYLVRLERGLETTQLRALQAVCDALDLVLVAIPKEQLRAEHQNVAEDDWYEPSAPPPPDWWDQPDNTLF